MKKFLVLTTVNPPSDPVKKFASLQDWNVVVVADKKTPIGWKAKNTHFISVAHQKHLSFKIAKVLPWNSYARKNIGYLYAMQNGADVIAEADDDNEPIENWGEIPDLNERWFIKGNDFFNVYSLFTNLKIWLRGFPLQDINKNGSFEFFENNADVGVWQFLVDNDSDVDAIYRLIDNSPVRFSKSITLSTTSAEIKNYNLSFTNRISFVSRKAVVLDRGVVCPFNSQNTIFFKKCFPIMYLPCYATMRSTDIFRSLIAQPILWASGMHLGFSGPTAVHERNIHDYMEDFFSELPVYTHSHKIVEIVMENVTSGDTLTNNLISAYKALVKNRIFPKGEMKVLESWVEDLNKFDK